MAKRQISVDEYIEQSEVFAQPILKHIQECVHEVCPAIGEEIKWNFPCFIYNGTILANMAAFKQHATFGFWLVNNMKDEYNILVLGEKSGMGHFGKLTSLDDLPNAEILKSYIREAMDLQDLGVKTKPNAFKAAIPENTSLLAGMQDEVLVNFKKLSNSQQGEYHEWINEAKTDVTRNKRIAQTIDWVLEGKPRNWKYMKKWKE